MHQVARTADVSGRNRLFGTLFGIALAVGLLPPIYIWVGTQQWSLLGLPFPVLYALGVSTYVTVVCFALYRAEHLSGELD